MLPRTPHPDPLPTRSVMSKSVEETAVNGRGEGTELRNGARSLSTPTIQPSMTDGTQERLQFRALLDFLVYHDMSLSWHELIFARNGLWEMPHWC